MHLPELNFTLRFRASTLGIPSDTIKGGRNSFSVIYMCVCVEEFVLDLGFYIYIFLLLLCEDL
jgi:hypothetical protein